MLELKIDQLKLNIENGRCHEHRIQSIAGLAAAIFAERLNELWADGGRAPDSRSIDTLSAPPVSLNLSGMSDEQVANDIATAWLEALALKPK
jgi:hypothetical protein